MKLSRLLRESDNSTVLHCKTTSWAKYIDGNDAAAADDDDDDDDDDDADDDDEKRRRKVTKNHKRNRWADK